ncbi:MAG: hypothetical protein P8X96_09400 [Desulfobacteraceae bacterium]
MTDFDQIRQRIIALRQRRRTLSESRSRIHQRLQIIGDQAAEAAAAAATLPPSLSREKKELEDRLAGIEGELKDAGAQLSAAHEALNQLGSPQTLVEKLDDGIPFLLLPVKVETRFVTVKHVTRAFDRSHVFDASGLQPQVAGPDDAGIGPDGTAVRLPTLADLAATGGQAAARQIGKQIAAGAFAPADGQWLPHKADARELWIRIYPDDIFVHSHEAALTEAEKNAGQAYWNEVWQAEHRLGKAAADRIDQARSQRNAQKLEAWRSLQNRYEAARAKWIIKATRPENFAGANTDFSNEPQFPDVQSRISTWTQAPQTFVLPDRFVVRLYTGETYQEYTGDTIDESILLGLDPVADEFPESGEALDLPEKLRWVSDFQTAEKMGMALRIVLTEAQFGQGFDRLVVLGLKLTADEDHTRHLVEELFYNHQYKNEGFSLLPQGTPTNNTDSPTSPAQGEAAEQDAYLRWSDGDGRTDEEIDVTRREDGRHLAAALGVDPHLFLWAVNSDKEEIREALAMNKLLWPATMGYFLRQFLFPLINEEDLKQTRDYFTRFVTGRGLLPCLRVDSQPYGIVPATAFSRWAYPGNSFHNRLFQRFLKVLDRHWDTLVSGVFHVGDPITVGQPFSERLMQMIGLHAGSVDFYVRSLVDPFFQEEVMQVAVDAGMDDRFWEIKQDLEAMGFHFQKFEEATRIFDMLFSRDVRQLDGPLIDSLPLSDKRTIRKLSQSQDNYLDWLAKGDLLNEIRPEKINLDRDQGLPLLYLLVRHALVRETMEAAIALAADTGGISPVAAVDQEREEMEGIGANHEFVLRKAIELKWQHAVAGNVRQLYDDALAKGGDKTAMAAFEAAIADAFDFFKADDFIRRTVAEAARKLSQRLVSQPRPDQIAALIAEFVKDVDEAVRTAVESEYDATVSSMVIEPDKWNLLSRRFDQVSGGQTMLEFIQAKLAEDDAPPALQFLAGMRTAIDILRDLPTARLERLLVEHIDLCSYRLDAWMLGLVHERLDDQRRRNPRGIYLGAFGYLEDVKPGAVPGLSVNELSPPEKMSFNGSKANLSAVTVPVLNFAALQASGLDPEPLIDNAFVYLGRSADTQLIIDPHADGIIPRPRTDDTGEGFIHTPSLTHANTAAILRSGYATYNQSNAQPSATDPFAVNLSSARVRRALYYLDGIRSGQELGALLGYQFERAVHGYADKQPADTGFVSRAAGYLLVLRKHFPMQTVTPEGGAGGNENVFNVVDGLSMLKKFQNHQGPGRWSDGILTDCPPEHLAYLDAELRQLEESVDALSDLLMAESVFQMAKGRPERSAAAFRVLNEGGMMETPEVIGTPRRGFTYTQRVGITLDAGNADPVAWGTAINPRALLNPHLNQWLSRQLPEPAKIFAMITIAGQERLKRPIHNAKIQPVDLLDLTARKDFEMPDSEFCVRIREQVRSEKSLAPDVPISIDFRDRQELGDQEVTIFDLLPLLRALSDVVQSSRPMLPRDLALPSQSSRPIGSGDLDLAPSRDRLGQFLAEAGEFSIAALLGRLRSAAATLKAPPESGRTDPQPQFDAVFDLLMEISAFGTAEAVPRFGRAATPENLTALRLQADRVADLVQNKIEAARRLMEAPSDDLSPEELLAHLTDIGKALMGRSFRIFPAFKPFDTPDLEKALNRDDLLHGMGEFAVEEWLQGVSLVRPPIKSYSRIGMLREAFQAVDQQKRLRIIQLAHGPSPWIAGNLPGEELVNGDTLSLALEMDTPITVDSLQVGLVADEWKEFIPEPDTTTGVAFNYNQPDTEAPQTLMLAVTPEETGQWHWDDLVAAVCETMDLAKKRAVDPDLLKNSALAHFLPAVVGPINDRDLYPSADFAKNIKVAQKGE